MLMIFHQNWYWSAAHSSSLIWWVIARSHKAAERAVGFRRYSKWLCLCAKIFFIFFFSTSDSPYPRCSFLDGSTLKIKWLPKHDSHYVENRFNKHGTGGVNSLELGQKYVLSLANDFRVKEEALYGNKNAQKSKLNGRTVIWPRATWADRD